MWVGISREQRARQNLEPHVTFERLRPLRALGPLVERGRLFLVPRLALDVALRLRQRLSQHARAAHACRRRLLLLSVHSLRVLAKRHLQRRRRPHQHLFDGPPGRLDDGRLSPDDVGAAGARVDRRDPRAAQVGEGEVLGVDGVDRAEVRSDRVGHLVPVVVSGVDPVSEQRDVTMRFDEPWHDEPSRRIDDLSALRSRGACFRPP